MLERGEKRKKPVCLVYAIDLFFKIKYCARGLFISFGSSNSNEMLELCPIKSLIFLVLLSTFKIP